MKDFWKNPYVLIALSLLIGFLVYGVSVMVETFYQPLPILGPKETAENGEVIYHAIPDFTLLDQHGDTVTQERFEGSITIADFFFTHCPSICPTMTANLKEIQARFDEDEIQIASFSVDPVRDSSERLMEYAEKFGVNHENWTFLTGEKKTIYLLARNAYFISASEGSGGKDDFIHSDLFTLVDPKGRIRGYYRGTKDDAMADLVRDIKRLQSEI